MAILIGCATNTPFHQTQIPEEKHQKTNQQTDKVEIVVRDSNPVLERMASVVEMPSRILPLGPEHSRHKISTRTTEILTSYLQLHDLSDIYVCVNEYDPAGEWRRLQANRSIGPGWRYSLGILSLVQYTLFPSPVFGGNQYNPFTNRLSVEVDEPVALLYEAAYAKDVRLRSLPGTYAAMSMLPGFSLVREVRAVNDVASFSQSEDDWEMERGVYRKLYPRVGTGSIPLAIVILPLWWEQALIGMAGPASGYVVGRFMESRRERELTLKKSQAPVEARSRAPNAVEQLPNWEFIEEDLKKAEVQQTVGP